MLDPSLSTSRKQRKSGKRHQQTADVVLDPDDMVHQIFLLKKELLASANEKTQLKTEVRRLDHEVAEIRNMDLMDDNLATKVRQWSSYNCARYCVLLRAVLRGGTVVGWVVVSSMVRRPTICRLTRVTPR